MINPEVLGIIATLFIIIAFLCQGELRIRLYDLVGAILFVIYGTLIKSFSTILLNAILILVQLYHINKLRKENQESEN